MNSDFRRSINITSIFWSAREHLNIYKNAASWLQLKSSRILRSCFDSIPIGGTFQGSVPNQEMLRMMNCCGWLRVNLRES